MRLYTLLENAGLKIRSGIEDLEITGVCSNSKYVCPGNLFVSVKGASGDGCGYIGEAERRGAAAIAVASECGLTRGGGIPSLYVGNIRASLARLVSAWYGNPAGRLKIIGVTGTNGKTTVASMLAYVLNKSGRKCGLIGTNGCFLNGGRQNFPSRNPLANMTTPEPEELYAILSGMADGGAEYAVMEVTSHALLQERVAPIEFAGGIFTNLSPDHLDLHGDMESYFGIKSRLFQKCGFALINTQNPYGRRLYDSPRISCVKYGCSASLGADYSYSDAEENCGGVSYRLKARGYSDVISCGIPGGFNVMNSMQVFACADLLGIERGLIRQCIADFPGVLGRMESVLPRGAGFEVIIDYAHTPDALENLLKSVIAYRLPEQRIVLLFGCGGDRDRSKRRIMGNIASKYADMLIITSDNSRSENPQDIISEILKGVNREKPFTVLPDRKEAVRYAVLNAEPGDIVLLAGKGHETYQINADGRSFFSERQIVTDAYVERNTT